MELKGLGESSQNKVGPMIVLGIIAVILPFYQWIQMLLFPARGTFRFLNLYQGNFEFAAKQLASQGVFKNSNMEIPQNFPRPFLI